MTIALYVLAGFIVYVVFGIWLMLKVYTGYGFVMAAITARDLKVNPSAPMVLKVDTVLALYYIFLDGLFNILYAPVIFLDPDPRNMFVRGNVRGLNIILPELVTGRCSRYGLNPDEWAYRKYVCAVMEAFLGPKDPKGWHIAGAHQRINWLYGDKA